MRAAVAVSAPVDLNVAGHGLGRGINRLYTWHFLSTLKPKSLHKAQHFPGLYDAARWRARATCIEFDNLVTAPLHGFKDADDYWTRASSKADLQRIEVPTLLAPRAQRPLPAGPTSAAGPRRLAAA